ncbi:YncE family protein [Pendulispora albinea]|uniref:YncE family protein n=1 Tax=Pendulispora albinea TaxID=2741071 RepID=A0ABZ2M258_9BACT
MATAGAAGCSDKSKERNAANLPITLGLPQPITYDAVYVVNGTGNAITVIDAEKDFVNPSKIFLKNTTFPHYLSLSNDRSKLLVTAGAVGSPSGDGGTDGGTDGAADAGDAGNEAGATLTAASAPAPEVRNDGVDALHEGEHAEGQGHGIGAVLVLNAATGTTIKGRFTDGAVQSAVFGANEDEVWAAESTTPGNVLVMLTTTLVNKASIKVGDQPGRISIAQNERYAFVANTASNSVTAIDTATKIVPKNGTIAVGNGPIGAWQGPDDLAYVENAGDTTITAIDTRTLEVRRTFKLGFVAGAVGYGADNTIWVTDPKGGRVVLFSATGVKTWEIPTGAGAYGIAFSDDKKTAYVANSIANTVSVINVAGRIVRLRLNVGGNPNWVLFRPKDKNGPGLPGGDGGR